MPAPAAYAEYAQAACVGHLRSHPIGVRLTARLAARAPIGAVRVTPYRRVRVAQT